MTGDQDKLNMPSSEKRILVVGYGNTLRGDDGVGQIIAEKIENLGLPNVETLAIHQLTPDMAGMMKDYNMLIFIDASEDITIDETQVFDLFPSKNSAAIEHAMSPDNLLRLCLDLYSICPESYIVLLPARIFSFTEELSDITKAAIPEAINIITAKIKNIA